MFAFGTSLHLQRHESFVGYRLTTDNRPLNSTARSQMTQSGHRCRSPGISSKQPATARTMLQRHPVKRHGGGESTWTKLSFSLTEKPTSG